MKHLWFDVYWININKIKMRNITFLLYILQIKTVKK